jgi:hypothetical protein
MIRIQFATDRERIRAITCWRPRVSSGGYAVRFLKFPPPLLSSSMIITFLTRFFRFLRRPARTKRLEILLPLNYNDGTLIEPEKFDQTDRLRDRNHLAVIHCRHPGSRPVDSMRLRRKLLPLLAPRVPDHYRAARTILPRQRRPGSGRPDCTPTGRSRIEPCPGWPAPSPWPRPKLLCALSRLKPRRGGRW